MNPVEPYCNVVNETSQLVVRRMDDSKIVLLIVDKYQSINLIVSIKLIKYSNTIGSRDLSARFKITPGSGRFRLTRFFFWVFLYLFYEYLSCSRSQS